MWQTICMMLVIIVTAGAVKITPTKSRVLVAESEPLNINCTAPSSSDLEWTKNGENLPSGVEIHQKIENGDNVSILSISAASLEISGTYRCKDKKSSQEGSIQVTVINVNREGALFEYQKGNTLTCNVETGKDGIDSVTYKWFKNGTNVEDLPKPKGEKFKLHDNGTLELLPITTTREDAGMYTCEVMVTMGNEVNVFTVPVPYYAEPMVVPFEKSKNLVQEERLDIRCRVLGYPTPTISWYKDSEEIKPDEEGSRFKFSPEGGVPNGQLKIDSVDFDDAADYKCMASAQHINFSDPTMIFNSSEVIVVRVKDKLAALWPFLGIVAEVVILCTVIFIYEKKRNKDAAAEDDVNQDGATPQKTKEGVRHRGNTNNPRA